MKVVVNVPSLAIEEVTPSFQSDANLLAPEEVQAKPRPQDVGNPLGGISFCCLLHRVWEKLKKQKQINLGQEERKRNGQRC